MSDTVETREQYTKCLTILVTFHSSFRTCMVKLFQHCHLLLCNGKEIVHPSQKKEKEN